MFCFVFNEIGKEWCSGGGDLGGWGSKGKEWEDELDKNTL